MSKQEATNMILHQYHNFMLSGEFYDDEAYLEEIAAMLKLGFVKKSDLKDYILEELKEENLL